MTKEEIRIAIAEACEWEFEKKEICPYCNGNTPYEAGDDYGITLWKECIHCHNTGKVNWYYTRLPELNLDAMHEAEKVLPDLNLYRSFLYLIVLDDPSNKTNEPAWATATQRAEAFLRTLNLWKPT
jgi:hypothetical protein